MINTSIEKMASDIGFDIGMSDDITQANLLNGFCKGIGKIQSNRDREMQICYIEERLTNESRNIITEIYKFVELRKEETK